MNKKQIRRLLSPAICVLIAAASCLTAFAAANTLTIEECDDLQITLPDNMTAVTRSSESDASYYTDHNLSYVDVQEAFLNGDIYMQAMDDDNAVTLTMSYLETDAKDFTDLTDDKLSEVARGFVASINSEVQYDSSTCDETGIATPWIFFNMSVKDQDGNVSRQYQATTVKNGKNVTLNLYRNGGDVEESDYAVIESVARTVKLNATPFYKNRRFWLYVGGAVFLIALIIFLDEPHGSPLFIQTRTGKNGKEFRLFKFRSMVVNAEALLEELRKKGISFKAPNDPTYKVKDDPRMTRFGKFIRKTSIDELPQLLNIIMGHMSIVGPRPPLPREVKLYNEFTMQRLLMRPGLTCIWQSTHNRDDILFPEWMKMDVTYLHECSFLLDCKLIIKTFAVVFTANGN